MSKPHPRGTADFIALRASSVLLLPFVAWLLYQAVALAGADYETVRSWASQKVNALALAFFIVVSAFHMRIGAGEIITDYLRAGSAELVRVLNWLVCLCTVGAAVYAAAALAF